MSESTNKRDVRRKYEALVHTLCRHEKGASSTDLDVGRMGGATQSESRPVFRESPENSFNDRGQEKLPLKWPFNL